MRERRTQIHLHTQAIRCEQRRAIGAFGVALKR
jgi:hypothetical protein